MSGVGAASAPWTDTHCHLHYGADQAERAGLVERAVEAGVGCLVTVGTDEASSRAALSLAAQEWPAEVYATVGLHPHDASQGIEGVARLLSESSSQPGGSRLVAVGECGLDYYYDHSPRQAQREAFAAQVRLAHEHDLALVVHTREAFEDTFAILRSEGVPSRTVFHCFTGGPSEAAACLELGAYLSFSGIVTFKNAAEVREASRLCPLERVLVETDSPYLAPVPHRGSQNEPAYVVLVGEEVARQKELVPAELATATSENARAVFGFGRC